MSSEMDPYLFSDTMDDDQDGNGLLVGGGSGDGSAGDSTHLVAKLEESALSGAMFERKAAARGLLEAFRQTCFTEENITSVISVIDKLVEDPVGVVTILLALVSVDGKKKPDEAITDNNEVCLRNAHFDHSWCPDLSKKQGCQMYVLNLIFAAAEGDLKTLKRYYKAGMDMSLVDYDHRAAIHLSAAEGHLAVTKFLLEEAKVPASPRDRYGNTPMDEAKRFERDNVIKYLRSKGHH